MKHRMRFRNAAVALVGLLPAALLHAGRAATVLPTPLTIIVPAARDANAPGGLPLHELMDIPMRDPNITRGPDGNYYLVGTTDPAPGYTRIGANDPAGQMWTINDGIRMWKSPDLVHWKSLGLIWSIDKDGANTWVHWWPAGTPNPGTAIWAPEIHYLKGTYWIPYCTKLQGPGLHLACGLLRSVTGRPEGPYRDVQPSAPLGMDDDASLFQDTDGTVYYLFDGYKIARMKPDMSGLAEPPRVITFAQPPGWGEGIYLVKVNRQYIFINSGTASFDPQGKGAPPQKTTYDCFSAVSTGSIYGPYTPRYRAIPHDGHNNLFQDKKGYWWATYFGSDPFAPFAVGASGRPCILPITIGKAGHVRWARTAPRPQWDYTTVPPSGNWTQAGGRSAGWKTGDGAFGDPMISQHGQVTDVGTAWTTRTLWLRKTFLLRKPLPQHTDLYLRHDGPIEVFLNGRKVFSDQSATTDYVTVPLPEPSVLKSGRNRIAVRCEAQALDPAYVDVGLVQMRQAHLGLGGGGK